MRDCDDAAMITDKTRCLQRFGCAVQITPVYAEHLSEVLLGQRHFVADAVLGLQ